MKELEKQNTQLARLVARQALEKQVLKDIAEGDLWARPRCGAPCVTQYASSA
ncbi:MAG: hypothetical protein P1V81_17490 [Planctomycetota bacterium]|nr:hypothetical protein [Planctomycetota bacterium]